MTQAQVVARLIGMVATLKEIEQWDVWTDRDGNDDCHHSPFGAWVRHSDLTAAVGLGE